MASHVTTSEVKMFIEMNRKGFCIRDISIHSGRCEKTVSYHLRSMGIDAKRNAHSVREGAWTFGEIRKMVTMYRDNVPLKVIAKEIKRSYHATLMQLYRRVNKRTGITKEQRDFIRKNYGKMTSRQIGQAIGINPTNVRSYCIAMGLSRRPTIVWTEEKIQFIKDNYSNMDNSEIISRLGVTKKSLAKKAHMLGLKKSAEYMQRQKQIVGQRCIKIARLARSHQLAEERKRKAAMEQKKKTKQQESFSRTFMVNPFDVNRTVPMNYVEECA